MKRIGLLGGMSFESSAIYYKMINEAMRARLGGLHSAELIMHSVNFAEIVALQKAGDWAGAAKLLSDAAKGLETAGADCVLICTNTMHLVAEDVAGKVEIPLLHIIDETAAALSAKGCSRPLLLATRYTMEHGFYVEHMRLQGIEVMVPEPQDRARVHDIIFDELCAGTVRQESRAQLLDMIDTAARAGADSVILGCTEICLILDPAALPLPGFDSTAIHARAAVDFALGTTATLQEKAA